MTRKALARLAAIAAIVVAAVVLLLTLVSGTSSYTVEARFMDAGGLVKGSLIEVGGAKVGEVADISLTPDSQAVVKLRIDDEEFRPLHRGTRASVRAVGLSGVANRFVQLAPGPPDAPEIPDGGVLDLDQTRPIVDLDVLLNALDEKTRRSIQRILVNGAKLYEGDAAAGANETIRYLNPALSQSRALAVELVRDPLADERLIVTGAATASALASRRSDLEQGIVNTSLALRAIAAEREHLEGILGRAPSVLGRAQTTLRNLRNALRVVRPALREARPAAAPLARVLQEAEPTLQQAVPVLADLRSLVPSIRKTLRRLPPLRRAAVPALVSTTSALRRVAPTFRGLRPYAPDLINSLFVTINNYSAGYDANGHYVRMALSEPSFNGILAPFHNQNVEGLTGTRTGLNARCPGGAVAPAADRSNPWIPDPSLCDPEDDAR